MGMGLWEKITGEQLNLCSLGLSNSCPGTAGTQQKHWLGAAPAGFGRCQLQGTHLEHSPVHVGHGSHLIHVPDPKVTHLENKRGVTLKILPKQEGAGREQMLSDVTPLLQLRVWSRSGYGIQGKLFQHPNHTGQFPPCFVKAWESWRIKELKNFTKFVFAYKAHRNLLPTEYLSLWGIFSTFHPLS